MGKDRYGCSTRKNSGTCTNAVIIRRQDIEGRVLKGIKGIKESLLTFGLVERFVEQCRKSWEASRREAKRDAGKIGRDLATCERQIKSLIDMVEQGLGNRPSSNASPRAKPRRPTSDGDLPPAGPSPLCRVCRLVHCYPALDRRKLDSPGLFTMTGW